MIKAYIGSLLATLLLLGALCSGLSVATQAHVQSGQAVQETWNNEFTLDEPPPGSWTYPIDAKMKAWLERGITFVGSGVVRVTAVKVDIEPRDVSCTVQGTSYTRPGAAMVAHVTWETPAEAEDGATGHIAIQFPPLRGTPSFHSGGYQKMSDGWVFREITAHKSALSLRLGRFLSVFGIGLSYALVLQGIFWALWLRKENRVRLAALAPADPEALPRVFHPSPIVEWTRWMVVILFFGAAGCLVSTMAVWNGYLTSVEVVFLGIILGIGIASGLIAAAVSRRSVVTVKLDADTISYKKGRGQAQWITARWADLRGVEYGSHTLQGSTTEWLDILFPDGKNRRVFSNIGDFPVFRGMVPALYAKHHPAR